MQHTPAYDSGFNVGYAIGSVCCPLSCLLVLIGLNVGAVVWWFKSRNRS